MRQARSGAVRCQVWRVTRPGLRQAHTGGIAGQGLGGGGPGDPRLGGPRFWNHECGPRGHW